MKKRLLLFALVLFSLFFSFTIAAQAHASLLRSYPEANAVLDRPPAQVELYFTEALEPSFSSIRVLDSGGLQVDGGDSQVDVADATRMTISLRSMPSGVYTVVWRALSQVDGHVTSGAFAFAVGPVEADALSAAGQAAQQVRLPLGEVLARWLQYLAVATLVGGLLFMWLVWQPVLASLDLEQKLSLPRRQLAWVALAIFLLANVLAFLVQAGQAGGSEFVAPWNEATGILLFTTRYGVLWLGRVILGLALGAFVLGTEIPAARWDVMAAAEGLLLVMALGSHNAAEPELFFPLLSTWLHLLAFSAWVGGLIHFVAGVWAARREIEPSIRTRLMARLIPRFSALALTSVSVLVLTGLYMIVLRVGTLDALIGTLYGRTLLVKGLLFSGMIFLGAINLLLVSPRMRRVAKSPRGNPRLVEQFFVVIRSEVGLASVLLLSVALLSSVPPARDVPNRAVLNQRQEVDDLDILLEVQPGQVGLNTFTITLHSRGEAVLNAREVSLRFSPLAVDVPPSEVVLQEEGEGRYAARAASLSLPDTWQVQLSVRREGQFDTFANFNVAVGVAPTQAFPWYKLAAGLLLFLALAFVYIWRRFIQLGKGWRASGGILAVVVIFTGLFVFIRPPIEPSSLPVNPILPSVASIAAGEALYQERCLPCHGVSGRGDGPVGLSLNPRPADLTLHTAPGVHPDGQLFLWISQGYPGSAMPAFESLLSEEQRWNLVNYIRTLAQP